MQQEADRQLGAAARASDRTVDLQIDWVDYSGNRIARFGGLWDKEDREFVGDAETSRVIRMHEGQLAAARWFEQWMAEFVGDNPSSRDPIFSVLLAGGRRGGKTTIGIDMVDAFAITVPESIVWVVCPADSFYDEPLEYIEASLPKHWYTELGAPHWSYYLVNGSSIVLRSAHTPRKLKHGRADFILFNEAQQMTEQAINTATGGTIDIGGLTVSAANPPDIGDKGTWVADMAAETERGMRRHSKYFFFDPEKNPEIDHRKLAALKESMSEHEYAVQIRGEFRLPPDAVLYAWDKGPSGNERSAPGTDLRDVLELGADVDLRLRSMPDVTRQFTKHFEGVEYSDLFAVDIQNYPWHALIRARVFENPDYPGDMDQALIWGIGEVFLPQGDEVELATEAKSLVFRGQRVDPERSLVVIDASADWQQATRDQTKQKAEYRGAGSMDMFRQCGFLNVVPPDRYMNGNPRVIDRCRAANSRICTASKRRLVFLDPELCPNAVTSVQKWRSKNGQPSRRADAAHGGDALTYLIWRFFPRRKTDKRGGSLGTPQRKNRESYGGVL